MSEQYTKEQQVANVPFFIHEATVERLERINKRWFIFALIVFIALVATNAGWIIYESQFETYSYEQEARYETSVETSILNNGTGRIVYNGNDSETEGEDESEENEQPQPDETVPEM